MLLTVHVASIPLCVLSITWLVSCLLLLNYRRNRWEIVSKPASRLTFIGGVFTAAYAVQLNANHSSMASHCFRFVAPLLLLMAIATLETMLALFRQHQSKYFIILWLCGLVVFIASLAAPQQWFALRKNADGYWIVPVHENLLIILIQFGDLLIMVSLMVIFIAQFFRKSPIRYHIYACVLLLLFYCYINDTFIAMTRKVPFPLSWISGLAFYLIIWFELRIEIKETQRQLNVDSLTGAYTRHYGESFLQKVRQTAQVGVLYCDIDNFKQVNDNLGHPTGDEALALFVKQLKKLCRKEDIVVRMGGDEFVIIFPGAQKQHGEHFVKRFENQLKGFSISSRDEKMDIQASFGWAWIDVRGDASAVLARSDSAMYEAKQSKKQPDSSAAPVHHVLIE